MGPAGHTLMSGAVGAGVWAATGSTSAAAVAVGVGVLMDLDHLYDFYQWYIAGRQDRVYILLHAWEYSIIGLGVLALGFYHPLLLAAVIAHLVHVATDHFHNGLSRFGYSITYRAVRRFELKSIAPTHNTLTAYQNLLNIVPFGRLLLGPWFRRRIDPWFRRRIRRIAEAKARAVYHSED